MPLNTFQILLHSLNSSVSCRNLISEAQCARASIKIPTQRTKVMEPIIMDHIFP